MDIGKRGKISYRCKFPYCRIAYYIGSKCEHRLFSIPMNEIFRKQWIDAMNKHLPDKDKIDYSARPFRVCGRHFVEKDFTSTIRNRLNKFAVPSVFSSAVEEKKINEKELSNSNVLSSVDINRKRKRSVSPVDQCHHLEQDSVETNEVQSTEIEAEAEKETPIDYRQTKTTPKLITKSVQHYLLNYIKNGEFDNKKVLENLSDEPGYHESTKLNLLNKENIRYLMRKIHFYNIGDSKAEAKSLFVETDVENENTSDSINEEFEREILIEDIKASAQLLNNGNLKRACEFLHNVVKAQNRTR